MTDDEVSREAWRREASHHEGHRNFRPHLRPRGANLMGLRGEQAFAQEFDRSLDLTARLEGDGGRDLDLPIGDKAYVVDCKAAIIPKDLICEVPKCRPETIYVLCRYHEDEDCCTMLGWQWGKVLMRSKPKDYGYGVINYWCPRGETRSMDELHRASRRGFVGPDEEGRFVHYCRCGRWGAFGFDVSLLRGKLGTWFCDEHRGLGVPKPPPPKPPPPPPPSAPKGKLF